MRPSSTEYGVDLEEEQRLHEVNIKRANATFSRLMLLIEHLKLLEGVSNILIDNTDLEKFDRKKYNPAWPWGCIILDFKLNGENQSMTIK